MKLKKIIAGLMGLVCLGSSALHCAATDWYYDENVDNYYYWDEYYNKYLYYEEESEQFYYYDSHDNAYYYLEGVSPAEEDDGLDAYESASAKAIEKAAIDVALAFNQAGWDGWNTNYSTTHYIEINVNGQIIVTRPDCSGFINAILLSMGYLPPGTNPDLSGRSTTYKYTSASGIMDMDGNYSSDWVKIPWSPGNLQPGDIQVTNGHMEFFMGWYNDIGYGFNMGSTSYIDQTEGLAYECSLLPENKSYLNVLAQYDTTLFDGYSSYSYIWRYVGKDLPEDINGDGEVTLLDMIMLNRVIRGVDGFTQDEAEILDIDGNNIIDFKDTEYIVEYLINKNVDINEPAAETDPEQTATSSAETENKKS